MMIWGLSQYKYSIIGISITKIRRSHDRLIFIMGILIHDTWKDSLYAETGPRWTAVSDDIKQLLPCVFHPTTFQIYGGLHPLTMTAQLKREYTTLQTHSVMLLGFQHNMVMSSGDGLAASGIFMPTTEMNGLSANMMTVRWGVVRDLNVSVLSLSEYYSNDMMKREHLTETTLPA